jgi:O-antigen/teichoic acid export membrane protein
MSGQLIARSTLWQLASQLIMAGLSILSMKFIALSLTKELAGIYNSSYGFLQIFGYIADFGLYAVALREMSTANNHDRVMSSLISVRALTMTIAFSSAILIAWSIPAWRATPLSLAITLAALVPFFTLLAGTMRAVFQVTFRMHWVFIAEVTQRIITASLIGIPVFIGIRESGSTELLYALIAVGGGAAAVLFFISFIEAQRIMPMRWVWDLREIKRLIRLSAPFGIAFLMTALYRQLDTTFIAFLRPDDFDIQNAYYGFVLRMVEMGYLIPTFLLNSALPLVMAEEKRASPDGLLLLRTLLALIIFAIITSAFALCWSRPLIALLTTASYLSTQTHAGSDTAFMIMSVPLFVSAFIQFSFYVLLAHHHTKILTWAMTAAAIFSIALNMYLIPRFGFIGAAATSAVTQTILAIVLWPTTHGLMRQHLSFGLFLRLASFALILTAILYAIAPLLTSAYLTIGGGIIMGVVIMGLLMTTGLLRSLGLEKAF